jgi:23S rRNA (adenine2503-C2)-methyltransferase
MAGERTLLDFDRDELRSWVLENGDPAYRADQLLEWVYRKRVVDFQEMTNLPRGLREKLSRDLPVTRSKIDGWVVSEGGTQKATIRLSDGEIIETVLIPDGERRTLCVSTQVGCAVGCVFCASGLYGVRRNLSSGEILFQFLVAGNRLIEQGQERLTNLVVMGIGEPLHNYAALTRAITVLNASWGGQFGARRITVSTAGVVSRIRQLAEEPWSVGLALSLHAASENLRRRLVPSRGLGGVAEILSAGRDYHARKGRRVTVEYCLLEGLNDSLPEAERLASLLGRGPFKVNLIPYNPVDGLPYRPSSMRVAEQFRNILDRRGITVTLRRARGDAVSAACGQLRVLAMGPGEGGQID